MPKPKRSGKAAAKKSAAKPRAKSAAKRGSAARGNAKSKAKSSGKSSRKSSREDALQQVVNSNMPEMEIAEKQPRSSKAVRGPTRPGPSINDYRRKYLGDTATAADSAAQPSMKDDDEVEVRQLRRKQSPADPADDPGPRTVILKKKKIIGAQG